MLPKAAQPSTPKQEKRALRQQVLGHRDHLSAGQRREASARILERLLGHPAFQHARGVHAFISFPEEVDTAPILEACARAGKAVFIPYQVREERRLGAAPWQPGTPLIPGPFGCLEPPLEARTLVDPSRIDLVLVPGVAFDRHGHRLGYGMGYYDGFLATLGAAHGVASGRSSAIALAFACQIVPRVPVESWDVIIPTILTEDEEIIAEPLAP